MYRKLRIDIFRLHSWSLLFTGAKKDVLFVFFFTFTFSSKLIKCSSDVSKSTIF